MTFENATILIVDDSPLNIKVLAECIRGGYEIKVATSGQQCLDIVAASDNIDLILLDIELPDIDGYEVCLRLKQDIDTMDIPIIFITGRNTQAEEVLGFKWGAVDYITKPINPVIVQARVKTHVTIKQQRDKLVSMAMYDQLTHLYNRYYLFDIGAKKISEAIRHQKCLSVLLLDVDHFKQINDTHGHLVGDQVLIAMGDVIHDITRKEDVAARFGGEEFVVILNNCSLEEAEKKAAKLCVAVAQKPMAGVNVTCSIGVASLVSSADDMNSIINRADAAMYRAKKSGRNRVMLQEC